VQAVAKYNYLFVMSVNWVWQLTYLTYLCLVGHFHFYRCKKYSAV
jgi:hypothetical protein